MTAGSSVSQLQLLICFLEEHLLALVSSLNVIFPHAPSVENVKAMKTLPYHGLHKNLYIYIYIYIKTHR